MLHISRRQLLKGAAALAAATVLPGFSPIPNYKFGSLQNIMARGLKIPPGSPRLITSSPLASGLVFTFSFERTIPYDLISNFLLNNNTGDSQIGGLATQTACGAGQYYPLTTPPQGSPANYGSSASTLAAVGGQLYGYTGPLAMAALVVPIVAASSFGGDYMALGSNHEGLITLGVGGSSFGGTVPSQFLAYMSDSFNGNGTGGGGSNNQFHQASATSTVVFNQPFVISANYILTGGTGNASVQLFVNGIAIGAPVTGSYVSASAATYEMSCGSQIHDGPSSQPNAVIHAAHLWHRTLTPGEHMQLAQCPTCMWQYPGDSLSTQVNIASTTSVGPGRLFFR